MKISRRKFFIVGALAGGGLAISWAMPSTGKKLTATTQEPINLNQFLTIDSRGNITFLLTKHEMGQGTGTGLPMIFMDELGGDWEKLTVKRADYDPVFDWRVMGTTGGSGSVMRIWDILRTAGATAREMLKEAAAERWKTEKDRLQVADSFVINSDTGEKLEFGALAEAAARLSVPENVKLKASADYRFVGKPVKNLITRDVVRGTMHYGIDMDISGMVYAAIERCPVYRGKLKDYDDAQARKVDGVIDIIPIPAMIPAIGETGDANSNHVQEGVAVIANSTWSAFSAKKLLKINWDYGEFASSDNKSFLASIEAKAKEPPDVKFAFGDTDELSPDDHDMVEVEYNNPHQAHALMEPLNATVHYRGDSCEVWVGNQDGGRITKEVAKVVGLAEDKVITHVLNSGGSFGRRYYCDSSMEAAWLSKQTGKSVKLTWTREDEIRHDYFHSYQRNYFKAMIKGNQVVGVENRMIKTIAYAPGTSVWDQLYYFPNIKISMASVPAIVHQGAWRSVAEHSATLGWECFIDELADRLKVDPLDYRLALIGRQYPVEIGKEEDLESWIRDWALPARRKFFERAPAVLNYVKNKGLWDIELKPGEGKGLALGKFGQTVVAHVAVVSVNDPEQGFKVERVNSVVHCGQVVNPHFGRGQIEGSIIWALSALKYGGLEVENGRVLRSNFHDNQIIRVDESPEINVHFIDSSEPPTGLGEPGTPPLAPAVLNAIFNATGNRIRHIPVRPEDIQPGVS